MGLGRESDIKTVDIEQAAVIHYDGIMKPWLDIGIEKYKRYWNRHVPYYHSYLQQCNIQAWYETDSDKLGSILDFFFFFKQASQHVTNVLISFIL